MIHLATLAIVAAAIVIALHSGSLFLILAALCGACGVATLSHAPAGY